MKMKSRQI